ncbi:MAG: hypothetical protein OYL97_00110 [Candidatus Poribacteria bacterium]|nr:hypothetical protein [Candidatus Poribacteria bacterium]
MRAGVLANERVIQFLNENFINTWVSNFELGRKPSVREYLAKRYAHESKSFDTTHPLAQAIKKGWHERSPVDCLIISPDFELKGKLPLNKYLYDGHDWDGGRTRAENYRLFLIEALEGKYPGFSADNSFAYLLDVEENIPKQESPFKPFLTDLDLVLNPTQPMLEVLDVIRTLEVGYQESTIARIDATTFEKGGILTIDIRLGSAELAGSFYLYDSDIEFPTERGQRYDQSIANATDVPPGGTAQITYPFYRGQVFKLAIAAAELSDKEEYVNAFQARISVEPAEKNKK